MKPQPPSTQRRRLETPRSAPIPRRRRGTRAGHRTRRREGPGPVRTPRRVSRTAPSAALLERHPPPRAVNGGAPPPPRAAAGAPRPSRTACYSPSARSQPSRAPAAAAWARGPPPRVLRRRLDF